ncbi:MarR family winged helix-turn-helix transcriptional regulator [Brevibacillus sp. NRS-1366]|uniref:MarR family winged helix-turn-helix transcriptional regulator n=1 Tax=Brevibacillus sp. NRS-1366 TaxID=3233899 RepID=UPI003D1E3760
MNQMAHDDLQTQIKALEQKMKAHMDTYQSFSPGIHRTQAALPIFISRCHHLTITLLNKHTLSFGLTHVKFSTMLLLFRSKNKHLTMTDISQQKHVTRTNITNLIDALEKDGYVERQKDPADRRSAIIHLTERGSAVVYDQLQSYWDRQKWIFDGLDQNEQEDMLSLICLLIATLQQKSEAAVYSLDASKEQARLVSSMMSDILDSYHAVTPDIHRSSAALSILLARVYNLTIFQLNKHTMELGLSHAKFSTLLLLFRSDGQNLTMTDISQQKNVTKTNVTKLIDGLEQDGLVQRMKDPADRRSSIIVLTEKSKAFIPQHLQDYWDKQKWVFNGLDETQLTRLLQLLLKLLATLRLKEQTDF